MGKSVGVDISPRRRRIHARCPDLSQPHSLEDGRMTDDVGSIPTYYTPKYRKLAVVSISRISHPTMVMLKIILNRFQPQAEEIIAETQSGFRAGRSSTEQILNLRILCDKFLQHQQNRYHVFINFKKSFDRVWTDMKKYSINATIIQFIENLYEKV